jgi:hypothetical protein
MPKWLMWPFTSSFIFRWWLFQCYVYLRSISKLGSCDRLGGQGRMAGVPTHTEVPRQVDPTRRISLESAWGASLSPKRME